nr:hypothetical protein [Tanacetum cinerariifolium]
MRNLPAGFRGRGTWDVGERCGNEFGTVRVYKSTLGKKGLQYHVLGRNFGWVVGAGCALEALLLDSLRKLPVDLAFAVDFQSCVDIVRLLTDI